jgi:hypothetical protein
MKAGYLPSELRNRMLQVIRFESNFLTIMLSLLVIKLILRSSD